MEILPIIILENIQKNNLDIILKMMMNWKNIMKKIMVI